MKTDFEQLDQYSRNLLDKGDANAFEFLLSQNENLKVELEAHVIINHIAKDFGYLDLEKNIQADLAKWRAEDLSKKVFKSAAIISMITAAILSLTYVWLNSKTVSVKKIKSTTNKSLVLTSKITKQKTVASKTEILAAKSTPKSIEKAVYKPIEKTNLVNEPSTSSQLESSSQPKEYKTLEVPMATGILENAKAPTGSPKEIDVKHAPIAEMQIIKPIVPRSDEVAEPVKKIAKKEYVIQPNLGEAFIPEIEEHQSGWLSIKNKSGVEVFKTHFANKGTAKWEPQNSTDIGQYLFEIRFDDGQSLYGFISILQ